MFRGISGTIPPCLGGNLVYSFCMGDTTQDLHAIYDAYQPRISRYLSRLVGRNEAEDLTQEVFVRVGKGLKDFRGDATLSTWIYRIATNVATDMLRSRSFRNIGASRSVSPDEAPIEDVDPFTGERKPSVERQAIRKEMSSCVHEYIDGLPETYRTVVILSDVEELTNPEIAEVLGLTIETVKIRLHRGRAKLREKLETGCDFDRDEEDVLVCDRKTDPNRSSE